MKRKAVQREIIALRKIDHPNCIKMYDLIETQKQICIVTDFVNGISMHHFVKVHCTNRVVPERTCQRFFKQIAEGFEYLHKHGIAHRDIKLDNILIEENTRMIKIIDFGFAAFTIDAEGKHQRHKIFCGTPSYMAPELVRKHEYDGSQVDMWALGIMLYAMLAGTFPFRGQSEHELYLKI
jgi:serine/threonine protein kinase